jgi:hypothetical protein
VTTLVLVILGGIWAAVIIVPLVRARTEGGLGDSIGTFRRHLSVLERAAPISVSPANRLRLPVSQSAIPPYRPPTGPSRARQTSLAGAPGRRPGSTAVSTAAIQRRRQAQRRRRDVLVALLAGIAGSLLLGMIHGLRVMLAVNIVLDLLFVAYIALLIRMRNLAAEREMKVTYLPRSAPVRGLSAGALAANARARAAGYGDGVDYGLPAGY